MSEIRKKVEDEFNTLANYTADAGLEIVSGTVLSFIRFLYKYEILRERMNSLRNKRNIVG